MLQLCNIMGFWSLCVLFGSVWLTKVELYELLLNLVNAYDKSLKANCDLKEKFNNLVAPMVLEIMKNGRLRAPFSIWGPQNRLPNGSLMEPFG